MVDLSILLQYWVLIRRELIGIRPATNAMWCCTKSAADRYCIVCDVGSQCWPLRISDCFDDIEEGKML
jgi:hypothetical protein